MSEIKLTPAVIQLRPFIKDKNFGLDEVLRLIQSAMNSVVEPLKNEVDELTSRNETLVIHINTAEAEGHQLTEQVASLTEQVKEITIQNEEKREGIVALNHEVIRLTSQVERLTKEYESLDRVDKALIQDLHDKLQSSEARERQLREFIIAVNKYLTTELKGHIREDHIEDGRRYLLSCLACAPFRDFISTPSSPSKSDSLVSELVDKTRVLLTNSL